MDSRAKWLELEFRAPSPVSSIQVEQVLRQRLRRECRHGDRFPSELELCQEFRVSRTLIRPILARLTEDGLLERRARLGRIATPRNEPAPARIAPRVAYLRRGVPSASLVRHEGAQIRELRAKRADRGVGVFL